MGERESNKGDVTFLHALQPPPAHTAPNATRHARTHKHALNPRTNERTMARMSIALALLGLSVALTGHCVNADVASISVNDAWGMLTGPTADDYVYVDVRTPEEFAKGHPENATNINVSQQPKAFVAQLESDFPDTSTAILFGCARGGNGSRSMRAAELAQADGYVNVFDVTGGYAGWVNASLPISM